ncbi:MAG: hypothetical protein R2852_05310 [Bacteroidia bacterium]
MLSTQSEEPKAAGLDLFSNQEQVVQNCPAELKDLFVKNEQLFGKNSSIEKTVLLFLDWIQTESFKDSKRQCILFLNYNLWKQYGPFAQRFNIEKFLFAQINKKQFDESEFLNKFFDFLNKSIEDEQNNLKTIYKNKIDYQVFNSNQKLAFNYLYENDLNLEFDENAKYSEYLKNALRSKGFINHEDYKEALNKDEFSLELSKLIKSGMVNIEKSNGEISLFLNTSLKNKKCRLYTYQSIKNNQSKFTLEEFKNQILVKSSTVIQFEQNSVVKEASKSSFTEKRQKAFFG